jgi:hypothetical protein
MDSKTERDLTFFSTCFWDVDKSKLDFEKDSYFIISRVLESGTFSQILALREIYTDDQLAEIVKSSTSLSPRVATYWAHFFHISTQEVQACLKPIKFQLRP